MRTCEAVVSTCAFGGGDDLYQPIGMTEASLRRVRNAMDGSSAATPTCVLPCLAGSWSGAGLLRGVLGRGHARCAGSGVERGSRRRWHGGKMAGRPRQGPPLLRPALEWEDSEGEIGFDFRLGMGKVFDFLSFLIFLNGRC